MHATLLVVGGKADKRELCIKLPTILGRSRQADLTIAHSLISRKHCALIDRNGVIVLRDLGSLNGTYVRGDRILGDIRLFPNDEFSIGPLTFQIHYQYGGNVPPASTASGQPPTVAAGNPPERETFAAIAPFLDGLEGGGASLDVAPAAPAISDSTQESPRGMPRLPSSLPGQSRIELSDPIDRVPSADLVIELDETDKASSAEHGDVPPVSAPFSIAPEDGQLPDFSGWHRMLPGDFSNDLTRKAGPPDVPASGDTPPHGGRDGGFHDPRER